VCGGIFGVIAVQCFCGRSKIVWMWN